MKPLFLYLIADDHDTQNALLAGLTPLAWLVRGAGDTPYRIVASEEEALPLAGYRYFATVHTANPLVTAESLLTLSQELEKRGLPGVALGKGRLLDRAAFEKKEAPKGRIESWITEDVRIPLSRGRAERLLYRRIAESSVQNGAIIPDVDNVRIDAGSRIFPGAIIEPYVFIKGSVVRENARIGAFSEVEDSEIGAGAEICRSVVKSSRIGNDSRVGPFAYIRPDSVIGEGCRVGDFVEIKKSTLGAGCKAAHLAYVGDAEVGERTNIGCGTVFANYNGKEKHTVKVGKEVFIGANSNLVAPLNIGDGAFIAAATTVTRDVPQGAFVIGRTRAENKERSS